MDDKRKNVRVRANLAVSIRAQNSRFASGSRTRDISESGACFPSRLSLPVNFLLTMELRSEYLKAPIKAVVRVVRVINQNDAQFPVQVGVAIQDIPLPNQQILREFIQHALAEGSPNGPLPSL